MIYETVSMRNNGFQKFIESTLLSPSIPETSLTLKLTLALLVERDLPTAPLTDEVIGALAAPQSTLTV